MAPNTQRQPKPARPLVESGTWPVARATPAESPVARRWRLELERRERLTVAERLAEGLDESGPMAWAFDLD